MIGLYIAYVIPICLRWRMRDKFEPGPWTLGKQYKWMCLVAVVEVASSSWSSASTCRSAPSGVPWEDDFEWSLFNYTPVVTGGLFAIVGHLVAVERAEDVHGPAHARSRSSDRADRGLAGTG